QGGHFQLNPRPTYIFTCVPCVATHCHCPFGIFTQVSVHSSLASSAFPDGSVPFPLKPPVAMAVSPKTVTFTSLYSALDHFVPFATASVSALFVTLPSLDVETILSARCGAIRSALFVFCDCSHVCSSAATAFSVSPPLPACDHTTPNISDTHIRLHI